MKPVSDQIESIVIEPIVINSKTLDTFHDSSIIDMKSVVPTADNVIFDNGLVQKAPGTDKLNSDNVSGTPVYGLHRNYANDGTKTLLRLVNGTLKSGPAAFATTVLSNLATNKRTPFIDIKGNAYGINETDGIIRYHGSTAVGRLTGIVGPWLRKKIRFFESDETWSTSNGGSTSNAVYRADEWTGKAVTSLKLNCSAATTTAYSTSNVQLNLTVFDNSKTVVSDDLVSLNTFHGVRNNISSCRIEFSTGGTNFANYYTASIMQKDFADGDHEWTKWNVRVGAFTTGSGSPDWSKVSAVRVAAVSNANGSLNVYFDNLHIKAALLKAYEVQKTIFNCEGSGETWTSGQFDFIQAHEGHRSRKLTGAATQKSAACALATTLDLTKWPDGGATSTSDEVVFWLRTNDHTAINDTNPLQLRIGADGSNYYQYTWASRASLGLTVNDSWVEVRVKRSTISATGGTPNWNNIAYVRFLTSTFTGATKYLWIDDGTFQQFNPSVQIADMESDETWAITGNGSIVTDPRGKGWVTEGTQALKLWASNPGKWSESYGIYDFSSAVKNLTQWSDGSESTTDDFICFSLFHQIIGYIEYAEIWFDRNSLATFANAYKFRVTKDMFAYAGSKNNVGKEIRIKKSDFDTVGTTGGWNTIGAIKFIVYSKSNSFFGSVYIDNVLMRRKQGKSGRYYYKYLFKIGADISSALSESSDFIDVKGTKVSLINMKTSQDSRITSREVYRIGGAFPETWMRVKIIEDNTTTEIVDDVNDEDLDTPLGNEVPEGWINSVLGNNLAYDPQSDRAIYWGDPTYKNRVYYSRSGYYHVVDETGYREFPDEVMFVVPWFGQNVIYYKNRIQKVMGDIITGELVDLPAKKGACSYWAVGKIYKGMIPFVGWDNVYLFDGIRETAIGDEVKNYFQGMESHLSTVTIGETKDILYISTISPEEVLGDNLVANGDFPTDLSSWDDKDSLSGISSWNLNAMKLYSGSEGTAAREQDIAITNGSQGILRFTTGSPVDGTGDPVTVRIGTTSGGTDILAATEYANGQTHEVSFTPTASTIYLRFSRSEGVGGAKTAWVDNVIVGEMTLSDSVVLRCYLPTKSWTRLPDWNVNVWSNWDKGSDTNEFYYGDSVNGDVYQVKLTGYLFDTSDINSILKTAWINFPDNEIDVHHILFKGKGAKDEGAYTIAIIFNGYKDFSTTSLCTATITMSTTWKTYQLGPRNIRGKLRGDAIQIGFSHDYGHADFQIKDIVLFVEKIPKRMILNEVLVT